MCIQMWFFCLNEWFDTIKMGWNIMIDSWDSGYKWHHVCKISAVHEFLSSIFSYVFPSFSFKHPPYITVSVVGSPAECYIPLSSLRLHLIGELQAQVLLEGTKCKRFTKGEGSDTSHMTFDLWPVHRPTRKHTQTQTPDLEPWQLWTSGLKSDRLLPFSMPARCCPSS